MRFGVLSWNARGINDPHRRKEVYKTALFTHADIICLQETWQSPETQSTDFGWKGPQLWSPSLSPSQHKHAGVAILCKRWIAKLKPIFKFIIPGRAMSMGIQMDEKTRIFLFLYSIQSVARLCHTKGRDGSAWERANASRRRHYRGEGSTGKKSVIASWSGGRPNWLIGCVGSRGWICCGRYRTTHSHISLRLRSE